MILVTKNILSLSFPSVFFLYLNAFLIIILVSHDMQTNSLQVELVCISSRYPRTIFSTSNEFLQSMSKSHIIHKTRVLQLQFNLSQLDWRIGKADTQLCPKVVVYKKIRKYNAHYRIMFFEKKKERWGGKCLTH